MSGRAARPRWARALALAAVAASTLVGSVATASPARADLVRDLQYWLDDYGIREAWSTTRGEGVTIAIIDTGVDGGHPDLAGAVVGGADFSGLGSSTGQRPVGSTGSEHGTLVGSLAAGRGSGADAGVIGAAPAADLLALSIGFGEGTRSSDEQIAEAVRWAVDNGADIINMSLTRNTPDWPESWDDAFLYAMENDVVVVAAAGNRGSGTDVVGAPATMPGVVVVGGVTRSGQPSSDASAQGITVTVSAPSEELVGSLPEGGHAQWSGTSGAAPIVSGVLALIRSAHPELDAGGVIDRLVATADDRGDPGQDVIFGYGLMDAEAAVADDVAPPAAGADPAAELAEWIRLNRRADAPDGSGGAPAPVLPTSPPVAAPPTVVGEYYPSLAQLRQVGVPLLVVLGAVGAVVAVTVRALRQYGAARRTG